MFTRIPGQYISKLPVLHVVNGKAVSFWTGSSMCACLVPGSLYILGPDSRVPGLLCMAAD